MALKKVIYIFFSGASRFCAISINFLSTIARHGSATMMLMGK
jgi:hypothetical protein